MASVFDQLQQYREQIDQRLSGYIHGDVRWFRKDASRGSWISMTVAPVGYNTPDDERARVQEQMVDAMMQLESVFGPLLVQLDV